MNGRNLTLALIVAAAPSAPAAMALYRFGLDRGMQMADVRERRRRRLHRRARSGPAMSIPPPARKCCTGTTRWCPGRNSTSPANRLSWICNWCRSMRTAAATKAGRDQPARAAEPRHAHRRSHAAARSRGGRGGRQRRLQRARRRAWCRRAPTASSSGSMCARRSTRCARASRWPSSTFPTGSRRRKNILSAKRMRGHRASKALRRRRAPAHAPGRHERRADPRWWKRAARCSRA